MFSLNLNQSAIHTILVKEFETFKDYHQNNRQLPPCPKSAPYLHKKSVNLELKLWCFFMLGDNVALATNLMHFCPK